MRCLVLCSLLLFAPARTPAHTTWTRPVDGPGVRAFDPPKTRFGPGHVGVDLGALPGTPVRAAGPGIVVFAGTVANTRHVVVLHLGNLRTSYSFLKTITVQRGERVVGGQTLGTSGGTGPDHDGYVLHFGLRHGPDYEDPMSLFDAVPVDLPEVVHLAPLRYPHALFAVE